MRRTLALLMTSWVGVVVALLVALLEIMLVSGIMTATPFRINNEWWPIWWVVILGNSVFLGVFYSNWIEGLRKEGKAILAAKLDNDPPETVG
ncbi:hypothetical protein SEA_PAULODIABOLI_282 [Microbacterium phage PauloDiaboli]|nr:hypothetical protein SEA_PAULODIABOLI_282 [Microbacterium phage PauloDiaboli]QWY84089.1 hypothetical protein SEA_A3WALLY_282 [Microbacterium phage A3Wally]